MTSMGYEWKITLRSPCGPKRSPSSFRVAGSGTQARGSSMKLLLFVSIAGGMRKKVHPARIIASGGSSLAAGP